MNNGKTVWTGALIRIAIFLGAFAMLQLSWQALHGGRVERVVIDDFTVRPAAYLAHLITPSVTVRAEGS